MAPNGLETGAPCARNRPHIHPDQLSEKVVALELAAQSVAVEPQRLGGLRLVATASLQNPLQKHALELVAGLVETDATFDHVVDNLSEGLLQVLATLQRAGSNTGSGWPVNLS